MFYWVYLTPFVDVLNSSTLDSLQVPFSSSTCQGNKPRPPTRTWRHQMSKTQQCQQELLRRIYITVLATSFIWDKLVFILSFVELDSFLLAFNRAVWVTASIFSRFLLTIIGASRGRLFSSSVSLANAMSLTQLRLAFSLSFASHSMLSPLHPLSFNLSSFIF